MRYCPICWSHRKLSNIYHGIRYWWLYSVLKKPKPSAQEIVEKLIPPLITTMVGLKVLDEFVRAMDGYDERRIKKHKKKEVKRNDCD